MAAQGVKMGAHTQPTGVKPPPPLLGSAAFRLPHVSDSGPASAPSSTPSLVSGVYMCCAVRCGQKCVSVYVYVHMCMCKCVCA
jgi:hypothetical protein